MASGQHYKHSKSICCLDVFSKDFMSMLRFSIYRVNINVSCQQNTAQTVILLAFI